ncbi:MAG: hypothetical protein HYV29_03195 [Ignavibacteriales bacterium]|nr:hypothetical protein [Ignavibacteriales bacterium]
MNCKEFQECACEIVDKRLSDERTQELLRHANVCPHCRYELQALQTVKTVLHEKVHRKSVPAELYYTIVNRAMSESGTSWFQKLFGIKLNPAIAVVVLAAVLVGAYSLLFPVASIADESNIINQSLENYQAVIGGSIKPQLVSNHDEVRSFLQKEVNFSVNVPKMKNCKSCAGVLSIFKGVKLAHVVYEMEGNIIYIYQANLDDVMKGDKIGLPENVKVALEDNKWYIEETNNKTVVLWQYKNTLCAAVSKLKKDHLVALLTE